MKRAKRSKSSEHALPICLGICLFICLLTPALLVVTKCYEVDSRELAIIISDGIRRKIDNADLRQAIAAGICLANLFRLWRPLAGVKPSAGRARILAHLGILIASFPAVWLYKQEVYDKGCELGCIS